MASHAENYNNPAGIHPSLPNYLWLEAGTGFGIKGDGTPPHYHQSTHAHLVSLLESAGISWKAYQEDISGTDCPIGLAVLSTPMDRTSTLHATTPLSISTTLPITWMPSRLIASTTFAPSRNSSAISPLTT